MERMGALTEQISQTKAAFVKLSDSLPADVRPCVFSGFGDPREEKDNDVLLGWSYDWSDTGPNPPPWSDWPDKTE